MLKTLRTDTKDELKQQSKAIFSQDIPESLGFTPKTGTLKPNETFSLADVQKAEERGYQKAEVKFSSELKSFNDAQLRRLQQEEAQSKQQISAIREEIAKLAKSVGSFMQEVEIATMQIPTKPGKYHTNFYSHLRTVIISLKQKVESSRSWLAASKGRSQKQSYYWGQVKNSGSKFMLSSERYMVTSTG